MDTMEECISMDAENIIALTDDQSRDVVPIMVDIRRAAENIMRTLNEGDPVSLIDEPITGVPIGPPDVSEIEPMLVLTTGHLTEFTCNTMLPAHDGAVWQKGEYGWFVYVVEDDAENEVPEDLRQCMEFARKQHCFWIMFDRDGSTVESLPVYDW